MFCLFGTLLWVVTNLQCDWLRYSNAVFSQILKLDLFLKKMEGEMSLLEEEEEVCFPSFVVTLIWLNQLYMHEFL